MKNSPFLLFVYLVCILVYIAATHAQASHYALQLPSAVVTSSCRTCSEAGAKMITDRHNIVLCLCRTLLLNQIYPISYLRASLQPLLVRPLSLSHL